MSLVILAVLINSEAEIALHNETLHLSGKIVANPTGPQPMLIQTTLYAQPRQSSAMRFHPHPFRSYSEIKLENSSYINNNFRLRIQAS